MFEGPLLVLEQGSLYFRRQLGPSERHQLPPNATPQECPLRTSPRETEQIVGILSGWQKDLRIWVICEAALFGLVKGSTPVLSSVLFRPNRASHPGLLLLFCPFKFLLDFKQSGPRGAVCSLRSHNTLGTPRGWPSRFRGPSS